MKHWTETWFALTSDDQPSVCAHPHSVTLAIAGYALDGQGFTLELTRAHLGVVQQLADALAALPPAPQATEPADAWDPATCALCDGPNPDPVTRVCARCEVACQAEGDRP